ncbi:MAG: CoA transferase [Deltaproteobacteria bacterium]|nr:CoA transferase [Deltaproteobacteria bacterium]MBT4640909.1 CoA transferase [Deltaproteobacteria bacterium]MBT6498761.1 CoA transferase [Deltaproteobacteria bacterium]MBT7156194.1 CoA transferase [Deltaproteobacteria bacterium]MBT7716712.1 CoA transferase [Deltaproteobacteria bacterium]
MEQTALGGMKVVEFCSRIGGAYCTKLMADMGAEVIKVEPPARGDDARRRGPFQGDNPHPEKSGHFFFLNSNKLGITLNPSKPAGSDILKSLIKDADVLVEDTPPGMMEKLGLGYETLREINPGLIMTSITAFGRSGPYKDYKAAHLNISHVSGQGYMLPIPAPDINRPPVMPGGNKGGYDIGITALVAVLAAYYKKGVSGKGQLLEISRQEALMGMQRIEAAGFRNTNVSVDRSPKLHRRHIGGMIACKDGYVTLLTPQERQWESLLEMMGNPEWSKESYCVDKEQRSQRSEEINLKIADFIKGYTRREIVKLGQSYSIPFSPVNTAKDIVESEQFNAVGFFKTITHPVMGEVKCPTAPYRFSKTPWLSKRAAPLLGEHNEEIYCERLKYDKEDLIRLRQSDII